MESIDFHEGLPTGSPVDSDQVVSSILFSDAAADVVDSDLFDQSMACHPEGFEPSIKVSLLDKLQSWALHRSAVDHAAKKEMEASLHAWHASMINDPGNIDVMGEYFDFLLEQDLQRLAVVDAARSGLWYLRLTSTNRTAVRRVSRVFDFYGHHDLNRFFLDEIREDLDAEERKFFLKSTFLMPASKPLERPWSPSMKPCLSKMPH